MQEIFADPGSRRLQEPLPLREMKPVKMQPDKEIIEKESRELCDTLLRDGIPADAECIYAGRNRLYRHRLPCGETVNIKAFRRPGALKGLIYGLFTTPKSKKSYINARRLLELGFETPEPYAHAEEKLWGGMRLGSSYYISRQAEGFEETRWWERWCDRDEFVEALGLEMARLYRAGVLFRDFSPGNVLLTSRRPYRFMYVDVNRTDFNVKSRRRMMTMFKRINIVEAETGRLGEAMARAMGWDEAQTRREALQVLRRFLWWKDSFLRTLKRLAGKKRK